MLSIDCINSNNISGYTFNVGLNHDLHPSCVPQSGRGDKPPATHPPSSQNRLYETSVCSGELGLEVSVAAEALPSGPLSPAAPIYPTAFSRHWIRADHVGFESRALGVHYHGWPATSKQHEAIPQDG